MYWYILLLFFCNNFSLCSIIPLQKNLKYLFPTKYLILQDQYDLSNLFDLTFKISQISDNLNFTTKANPLQENIIRLIKRRNLRTQHKLSNFGINSKRENGSATNYSTQGSLPPPSSNLHRTKRSDYTDSTIINFGILAKFLGIGSASDLNELDKKISQIGQKTIDESIKTRKMYNHIRNEIKDIEIFFKNYTASTIKKDQAIFQSIRLLALNDLINDFVMDIENSLHLSSLGLPNFALVNLNLVDNITSKTKKNDVPLFNRKNIKQTIFGLNISHSVIEGNHLIMTLKIPYVEKDTYCTLEKANESLENLKCNNSLYTWVDKNDCKVAFSDTKICEKRNCFYFKDSNDTCSKINKNVFLINNSFSTSCVRNRAAPQLPTIQTSHPFLLEKGKHLIFLEDFHSLTCSSKIFIPNTITQKSNLDGRLTNYDLILDINEIILETNNSQHPRLGNIDKLLQLHNEDMVSKQYISQSANESFSKFSTNYHLNLHDILVTILIIIVFALMTFILLKIKKSNSTHIDERTIN